jgi:ketosteroid isomerase-like protein
MEQNQNEQRIAECYTRMASGDVAGLIAMCDDTVVFTCHGSSAISGTFTKATIAAHFDDVLKLCNRKFRQEVIDTVANENRGITLLDTYVERGGKDLAFRTIHVWKIRNGKVIRWDEYPGSEAEFNRIWS